MSIRVQGNGGVVAAVDGTVYRALRVTMRPVDYGSHGSYRVSMSSDTLAADFGSGFENDLFQARWTSSSLLALVWRVQLDGMSGSDTAFAAGIAEFMLYRATAWTVDGSGGASAVLTGNNNKLRTSMATTSMGAIRISSTDALVTGTRTTTQSFLRSQGGQVFGVGTTPSVNYYGQVSLYGNAASTNLNNPSPMVLARNEGIVVTCLIPATGTWRCGVTMSWSEVSSY